jgi:OmpA-OmpF porin, OOP family
VREKLGADGRGATTPVANAQIIWANHADINPLLGGADGRFVTQDLPPGDYAFSVRAEGYKSGECSTNLTADTPLVQLECALEALPRVGVAVVHARDEQGGGIEGATVKLTAAGKEFQLKTDAQGIARFGDLPPGTVSVFLDADGYLTAVGNGDVKTRQDNAVDVAMHKKPKTSLVNIGKTEITIKQQVQFELNSAKIMAQSDLLLEEIADAMIKNPRLKRIEIQGHTDNTGTPDGNVTLSDARANAVRAWLTAHGVTPDRLVAKGYGQTRPLAPNVTANNKSRNRRVQFVILDQEAAATDAPTVTPKAAPKAGAKKPDAPAKLDLTGF